MPHILVAGKLHPSGVGLLEHAKTLGFSYDYVEEVSEPAYAPLIDRADALVIRTQPLTAATVARAERLRMVSRHGVGYDSIDLSALNARDIALTVVGDVNSVSVAEHAMMQMLAAAKRLIRADRSVRDPDRWDWRNRLESEEISGKHLLILGYGRIGRHLARMASGFEMQIRAFDPYLERAGWPRGEVKPVSDLRSGLSWADIVSVHVPKADRPPIGADEIAAMKPGAILINTARGGVVDELALTAALREGRIGAIGFDVFDREPPDASAPLLEFEQAILTPHIAGLTRESAERMALASVQNVIDFYADTLDPALVVNKDSLGAGKTRT